MTSITWDELIKQASTASFDPLPNGEYDVVCTKAEAGKSSGNKPMVRATFRIQAGPHAGRQVSNQFTISPENPTALKFFFEHMQVLGMDAAFFAALPSPNPDLGSDDPAMRAVAATLPGRTCRLKLEQQNWNGQPRNNVAAVLPAFNSAPNQMPTGYPYANPAPAFAGYPQAVQHQPGIPVGYPTQTPTPTPVPTPTPAPYRTPDPWATSQPAAPQYPYPQAPTPQAPQPAPQHSQQPSYPQPTPYAQPAVPMTPPWYSLYPQAPMPQPPQDPQPPQAPPEQPIQQQPMPPQQQPPAF